jgi:hypothetical protein
VGSQIALKNRAEREFRKLIHSKLFGEERPAKLTEGFGRNDF